MTPRIGDKVLITASWYAHNKGIVSAVLTKDIETKYRITIGTYDTWLYADQFIITNRRVKNLPDRFK